MTEITFDDFLKVEVRVGTVIAVEDGAELKTPYDDCIIIMPSSQLEKGLTAIRLGHETTPPGGE